MRRPSLWWALTTSCLTLASSLSAVCFTTDVRTRRPTEKLSLRSPHPVSTACQLLTLYPRITEKHPRDWATRRDPSASVSPRMVLLYSTYLCQAQKLMRYFRLLNCAILFLMIIFHDHDLEAFYSVDIFWGFVYICIFITVSMFFK